MTSRRQLIRLIGACCMAGLIPRTVGAGRGDKKIAPGIANDFLAQLPDLRAVIVRIEAMTAKSTPAFAIRPLAADRPFDSGRAFYRYLSERTSHDFASGRIVFVDGWLMARTEVEFLLLVRDLLASGGGPVADAVRNADGTVGDG